MLLKTVLAVCIALPSATSETVTFLEELLCYYQHNTTEVHHFSGLDGPRTTHSTASLTAVIGSPEPTVTTRENVTPFSFPTAS